MKKIIKQISLIGSIFTLLLALNGCGQKGPLYLPNKAQLQSSKQNNNSLYIGGGFAASKS